MSKYKFSLRAIQPSDSPGLEKLITEFDGDLITRFQVDPYAAIIYGTEYRTAGVVVECAGYDGLVGMGTVRFGRVQYNGDVLPFAFLDGLKVHKDFRGNGLGYQIASWRIQLARETFGNDGVIATGMLHDNRASHAVAAKWCRDFAESAIDILVLPTRAQPPRPPAGITVREIETHEYEEFADKQNTFYENYNLFAPGDSKSITGALSVSTGGKKLYQSFAVVDPDGNLLAGAQTWARGILKCDTVNNPPKPLRILNSLLHLLPPDFTIRDISVSGLWHEPGQLKVAKFLWETIRWKCKEQGTTLTVGFDPRDPARDVVDPKPWHQPRPKITLAIHGPAPIDRNKLMFNLGRV